MKVNDEHLAGMLKTLTVLAPTIYDLPSGCPKHRVFLSLYGGVGHMAESQLEHGRPTVLFDLARNPKNDLGVPGAQRDVLQIMNTKVPGSSLSMVGFLGIDIPCNTWSSARRGGKGPPAIRDAQHFWGLPGVRPHDQVKLDAANLQYRYALELIDESLKLKIPGYMENPKTSMLWNGDGIQALIRDGKAWLAETDLCQYGTAWKKGTRMLMWGMPAGAFHLPKCRGPKRGICGKTGEGHLVLRGVAGGKFLTGQAQVYPREFTTDFSNKVEVFLH
jgi:hypothetical protein